MDAEGFQIKTPVFEGPLELLLHLIEKRKLHINDISLATVTDDFLAYLKGGEDQSISKSAHFIWVASTLLLIKSRSLLPSLSLTEEEEGDIQNLERRLKLYKCFAKIAPHILTRFGERIFLARVNSFRAEVVFAPDSTCTIPLLYAHISAVIANLPKKESAPEALVQKVISLEEMVDRLSERISTNLKLSFKDFAGQREGTEKELKVMVIVSFLAMLELVKRGILDVEQDARFADITMRTDNVQTPRYT